MSATQPAYFNLQEFSDFGVLLVGGRLYTYAQGTTAFKTAYTDPAGAVPQTYTADGSGGQYIAINARGELPAHLYLTAGSYDIALKRADGSTVWTRRADPIGDEVAALAQAGGAAKVSFSQGAGTALQTVADALRERLTVTRFMDAGQRMNAYLRITTLDQTSAIEAGIDYLITVGGGELWFPSCTLRTTRNINVPSSVSLRGANRYASIIDGTDKTHTGFTFTGNGSEISSLFIRGMSTAIASTAGRFCKVFNNFITYNRIGIDWNEGYINSVYSNNITHNTYGMILRGQSYAFHIYDNVIDNNVGGCGVLAFGSPGIVLRDNTIEGNSVLATKQGVGLCVIGVSTRVAVTGNWFEQNGDPFLADNVTRNPYAVDILLGDMVSTVGLEIYNTCIPPEYKAQVVGAGALPGTVTIEANQFYQSRYSVMMRLNSAAFNYVIAGNQFNGLGGNLQKPIQINYISGGNGEPAYPGLEIRDNMPLITFGGTTDEMLKGVGGSYVYCTAITPIGLVRLDGVDLYTKRMTCAQFKALPGASMDVTYRVATGGTASAANTYRAQLGASGVATVSGTDRLRLGAAGLLTIGQPFTGIVIAKPGSQWVSEFAGGGYAVPCTVEGISNLFNVYGPQTPTVPEIYLGTGEYYGYCFMSTADAATHLKGALRVEITDLEIVTDRTLAALPPSSAAQNCFVGDTVYHSAPAAGGNIGWVCTAAGAPGTWKAFGTIAA